MQLNPLRTRRDYGGDDLEKEIERRLKQIEAKVSKQAEFEILNRISNSIAIYSLSEKVANYVIAVNQFLNTPPTKLNRMIKTEKNKEKKKEMIEALNAWRTVVPGPFRHK